MKLYTLLALFLILTPALAVDDPFQDVKDACLQSDGSINCMATSFNFGIPLKFEDDVTCFSTTSSMNVANMSNCYTTISFAKETSLEASYAVNGEFTKIEYVNKTVVMMAGNHSAVISPETIDLSKCKPTLISGTEYYIASCAYKGVSMTADLSPGLDGDVIIAKVYGGTNWEIMLYIIIGAVILALGYLIMKGRDKR